jgi:hypothetical protein
MIADTVVVQRVAIVRRTLGQITTATMKGSDIPAIMLI